MVIGRQSYRRETVQVRIDKGMHYLLKQEAVRQRRTIKELVEECLSELLEVKNK